MWSCSLTSSYLYMYENCLNKCNIYLFFSQILLLHSIHIFFIIIKIYIYFFLVIILNLEFGKTIFDILNVSCLNPFLFVILG